MLLHFVRIAIAKQNACRANYFSTIWRYANAL